MTGWRFSRITAILVLLSMAGGFGQFGAVSALGDVATHFGQHSRKVSLQAVVGLSGTTIGLGLAILRLASLGSLPLVAFADRRGRVGTLRMSIVAGLVVTAAAALSPSYWSFVAIFAIARPLLSASNILVQVVQAEVSSDATRVSRLAWIAAGAGGGIGLSAIAHSVLGGPHGFRIQFGLALIPALGAWWLLRQVREPQSTSSAEDMVSRLGRVPSAYRARLTALCVVAGIVGVITGPANSFAFVYGENVLHIPAHTVAAVVTASGISGIGGLLLSRRLVRRYGRRVTVASGVTAAAVTSALAYSGGQHAFIAGYLIGVGAAGLLAPASSALIVESFPHATRATASGWTVVAGIAGAVVGLVIFGFISDHVVAAHVGQSYRWPALLTFLPLLPALALLRHVPEPQFERLD